MVDRGAQIKWDHWVGEHPDLLLSVQRGPDLDESRQWMYVESQEETLRGFLRVLRRPGVILLGDLPDRRLRHWLYLEYLKRLPGHLVRPWRWLRKAHDARHQAAWRWVNIEATAAYAETLGCRVEILTQPPGRQYGITTYLYRRDVRLWVA